MDISAQVIDNLSSLWRTVILHKYKYLPAKAEDAIQLVAGLGGRTCVRSGINDDRDDCAECSMHDRVVRQPQYAPAGAGK